MSCANAFFSKDGGGSLSAFQWKTTEQVWPFEKTSAGGTIYCVEVDYGALPNNTAKAVAHGISGFDKKKLFNMYAAAASTGASSSMPIPNNFGAKLAIYIDDTSVYVEVTGDWSPIDLCKIRIFYWK